MTLIYLDLETTGLDPAQHTAWEAAWAVDDGPISSGIIPHTLFGADPKALEIGRYEERVDRPRKLAAELLRERNLFNALAGATIVGANPAFDTAFLASVWRERPWKYRLLDIETYAMPALGYDVPPSLLTIVQDLCAHGWTIPLPDHTAAGDVAALRACHHALRSLYAGIGVGV